MKKRFSAHNIKKQKGRGMRLDIDNELRALAELFYPHKIYAVGGCVRNALLGLPSRDTDVAGPLAPGEVYALKNAARARGVYGDGGGAVMDNDGGGDRGGFRVAPVNPRIGTLKLFFRGREFEYTAFRRDNYAAGHRPVSAEFTRDICEDAKRRDFTVNAIYYDVGANALADPLGGARDLDARVLRTCAEPRVTLAEDGLRLMRLVRFAAEYGFLIEEETLKAAKDNAGLICEISGERIRDELCGILNSDGFKDAVNYAPPDMIGPERGLKLLAETGLAERIMPELAACVGFAQPSKYHKYDVFTHIAKAVAYAPKNARPAALFHDIGKPRCFAENGNTYNHPRYGAEIAKEYMGQSGMKFPSAVIDGVLGSVRNHMFDIDGETSDAKVRAFIQDNVNIIDDLIELKKADYKAKGTEEGECPSALKMRRIFDEMKAEGAPFSVADLKIGGADMKRLGCRDRSIGKILKKILKACANNAEMLRAEAQFNLAVKLINEDGAENA